MTFNYSRPELIAKKVLEECGLSGLMELDLSELILGRGAFYKELPLRKKDGEIVSFNGRSIIQVNSNIEHIPKRRFTAAHELGHFEMHRSIKPIFSDTESELLSWYQGGVHEQEANEFAAELLMPSELFYNECEEYYFDHNLITYLADKFSVSKTAALLKFVKRGNHPICIICTQDNKMKWFRVSHDFRYFLEFEKDKTPPTDSVAYELFNSRKIYRNDELSQKIWQSTWFRSTSFTKNRPFFEYCLFIREYRYALSVVWEE